MPAYFEVFEPFQSFLAKVFAVQVEQNWWQTTSLPNSSSSLHSSWLPSVQSYFNTLSHVQGTFSTKPYLPISPNLFIFSSTCYFKLSFYRYHHRLSEERGIFRLLEGMNSIFLMIHNSISVLCCLTIKY